MVVEAEIVKGRCNKALDSGSYYDPLPWSECSLQATFGGYHMCSVDAGGDCPFIKPDSKKEVDNG